MSEHRELDPNDIDFDAPGHSHDEELDRLRRQWRLDKELRISFDGSPLPIRLSRHMSSGEVGDEAAIITTDCDEPEPRQPFIYIYTTFLDTKRMLVQLTERLARRDMMGSDEAAWQLVLHVEKLLGIEREAAIGEHKVKLERAESLIRSREEGILQLEATSAVEKALGPKT
jgi:hypothetical protein